jgi:hypothetical protein
MKERFGKAWLGRIFAGVVITILSSGGVEAQKEFQKATGKLANRDATKKVFVFETLSSGLCQSQPKPTLTIMPDGRQEFAATVRSTGAKDTYQAYLRYYNAAGSFLTEVKWWQHMMEKPNMWSAWKVSAKADPNLAKKFKDVRQVSFNYKC